MVFNVSLTMVEGHSYAEWKDIVRTLEIRVKVKMVVVKYYLYC